MPNEVTIIVQARNATKAVFDAVRKDAAAFGEDIGKTINQKTGDAIQSEARSGSGAYSRAGDQIGKTIGDRIRENITQRVRVAVDESVRVSQPRDSRGRFTSRDTVSGAGSGGIPDKTKVHVDVDVNRQSFTARMLGLMKDVGGRAASVFSNTFSQAVSTAVSASGPVGTLITLALSGLAIAAGPLIASALSAAVVTGVLGALGGGAIALGVIAAFEDPRIKQAAKSIGNEFKTLFKDFGTPFKPIVEDFLAGNDANGAGGLLGVLKQIRPMVDEIANKLAPVAKSLGQGVIGFLQNALPGVLRAIEGAAPILQVLADELPSLGDEVGRFFDHIKDAGPTAAIFFKDMLNVLELTIKALGNLIEGFAKVYRAARDLALGIVGFFVEAFETTLTAAEKAFGWIPGIGPKLTAAREKFTEFRKKINNELGGIKDKTVTVRIRQIFTRVGQIAVGVADMLAGRSHGGIVGQAASGGARNGLTWVGEHGPELLDLPAGTGVKSNPDSMRMARGEGGGTPTVVQLVLDSEILAEVLVDPTRRIVQRRFGGDVQAAYGR